jgi:tetratricopeptide (TPR) repeat protein
VLTLVLGGVTVVLFGSGIKNGFVNYDDEVYVSRNPHVLTGISATNTAWAFTSTYASNWHPLTWLSLQLDASIWGAYPGGFHLTSILLHAVNTALFFWLLTELSGQLWPSFLAAALFAWHPLRVESVAWVAERKDVLSALFWLLAMLAYVRYVRLGDRRWYAGVIVLFALGLMAKPMVVSVPCALLLLDYWPLKRWGWKKNFDGKQADLMSLGGVLAEKAPLFALAAASSAVTIWAQGQAVLTVEQAPSWARLGNAFLAYARYLGKTIWPTGLMPFYPYPAESAFAERAILAFLIVGAVSMVVLFQLRQRPYLTVGWLWYLGTLVPAIGLVQVGLQGSADRYTYIPAMGLSFIVAFAVQDLYAAVVFLRRPIVVASAAALLGLMPLTFHQVGRWHDSESLWRYTLDLDPRNYMAHYLLGLALAEKSEATRARQPLDEAATHYRQAILEKDNRPEPHYALARALSQMERLPEAAAEYRQAIAKNPKYAQAYNNLGSVFQKQGRIDEAIDCYQRALDLQSDLREAELNLRALRQWKAANNARSGQ